VRERTNLGSELGLLSYASTDFGIINARSLLDDDTKPVVLSAHSSSE
jgi:hypothetical protein